MHLTWPLTGATAELDVSVHREDVFVRAGLVEADPGLAAHGSDIGHPEPRLGPVLVQRRYAAARKAPSTQ
ncbi:hypothetical protein GCM10022222_36930 [Amycolatopsis ultiminotia]|uniref:Uncharacterized protein n=1 Tax=Amycolatopsis ultiminotia TaxID=543629 RepID=A0ABP6WCR1_9PSEU